MERFETRMERFETRMERFETRIEILEPERQVEPVNLDDTLKIDEKASQEAPKKSGKGKKGGDEPMDDKNSGDDRGTSVGEAKSPKPKADGGDAPEGGKKRRGKAGATAMDEGESGQDTPMPTATNRRGMKKTPSVAAVVEDMHELAVEPPEEQAAGGEGKGRGGEKRKKADKTKEGAGASVSQPDTAAASVKPKRGRPKKNYAEAEDADD